MPEEMSDAQMDAIIDGAPETGESQEVPEQAAQGQEQQAQPALHNLKVGGKEIQATIDQLTRWAQQGYHYAQQKHELEQQYSPYKSIDQYAQENPQWWDHVQNSWKNREQWQPGQEDQQAEQGEADQAKQLEQLLEQKYGDKFSKVEQILKEFEQQKQAQEDQELNQTIESFKEKYSNLDWQSADDNMLTLEDRIIQFANEKGISDFEVAFKAYNFENMVNNAQEEGKTKLFKDIQRQKAKGIIGKSATPEQGLTDAANLKSKSYQDLTKEALQELGLA